MAKDNDITFKYEELNGKFNFRVAALIENKDKVLLQKSVKDDYYCLIGGRVAFCENTKIALIREIEEETGVKLNENDMKLFKVVENFFEYGGKKFHELLYVYKVHNKVLNKMDNFKTLDKDDCYNKWYLKEELKNVDVRPNEFKEWICSKKTIEHIIIDEL